MPTLLSTLIPVLNRLRDLSLDYFYSCPPTAHLPHSSQRALLTCKPNVSFPCFGDSVPPMAPQCPQDKAPPPWHLLHELFSADAPASPQIAAPPHPDRRPHSPAYRLTDLCPHRVFSQGSLLPPLSLPGKLFALQGSISSGKLPSGDWSLCPWGSCQALSKCLPGLFMCLSFR